MSAFRDKADIPNSSCRRHYRAIGRRAWQAAGAARLTTLAFGLDAEIAASRPSGVLACDKTLMRCPVQVSGGDVLGPCGAAFAFYVNPRYKLDTNMRCQIQICGATNTLGRGIVFKLGVGSQRRSTQ